MERRILPMADDAYHEATQNKRRQDLEPVFTAIMDAISRGELQVTIIEGISQKAERALVKRKYKIRRGLDGGATISWPKPPLKKRDPSLLAARAELFKPSKK